MTQFTHPHFCHVLLAFLGLALCITSYAQVASSPQTLELHVLDGSSQRCTSDDDCSPSSTFQTCSRGLCKCKSVSHYDPSIKSCRLHIGSTCNMFRRASNEPCVENASCDSTIKLAAKGSCTCDAGFEENYLGLCSRLPNSGVGSNQAAGASFSLLFVAIGALVI